jgi:broad specificity phosphatase PhoE
MVASVATFTSLVQADTTIVIVRHGEKPAKGLGQLTCKGLNRALALAPLLLSRYGEPVAIYAPNPSVLKADYGVPYAYVRPLATIEPLAIRAGLPVNVEWGMVDIEPLVARILASPTGTHVVAWEHHWGESLARLALSRLGGNPADVPRWHSDDFDSIYVIRAVENESGSRRVTFSHEQEGLNGLPEDCADGPRRAQP